MNAVVYRSREGSLGSEIVLGLSYVHALLY